MSTIDTLATWPAALRAPALGRRIWARTVRRLATRLFGLSWQLHLIAAADVALPTGNRREALDLLTAAGFTIELVVKGRTRLVLTPAAARARRLGRHDNGWSWRIMFDTHVAVDPADHVDARIPMDTIRSDVISVLGPPVVYELASEAVIDMGSTASAPKG
ncbi:hypothetical protein HDA40_001922 [Hamadaea flava]|uniref:Uncharacterized protein n=1 Tax=Hamadaea flava TaxID=1742688 RepID=A0ABV8LFI4_9ACTN|nr:hypothetical protein [Hamadaea flava]MCP2323415.1 hypothetical protein [Hamadaea flava]